MRKYMLLLIFSAAASLGYAQTSTLSTVAKDEQYGFTSEKPVKVGGGPADQRAYLNQLRDPKGNAVTYVRTGSCCPYKTDSPQAPFGYGMVDIYEVSYRNAKNKKKKVNVYISFYDLEEPLILYGFSAGN